MKRLRFRLNGGEVVAAHNVKIVGTEDGYALGETDTPNDCAVLVRREVQAAGDFPAVVVYNHEYGDDTPPVKTKREWGKDYSQLKREEEEAERAEREKARQERIEAENQKTVVDGEEVTDMAKKEAATQSTPEVKKVSVASIITANAGKTFEEIKAIVKAQRPDVADSTIKVQYNKATKKA